MSFMVRWSLKAWNRTCLSSSRDICCMSNCGVETQEACCQISARLGCQCFSVGQCWDPTVIYYGRISFDRKFREVKLVRKSKMSCSLASHYINQVFTCSVTLTLAPSVMKNEKKHSTQLIIHCTGQTLRCESTSMLTCPVVPHIFTVLQPNKTLTETHFRNRFQASS